MESSSPSLLPKIPSHSESLYGSSPNSAAAPSSSRTGLVSSLNGPRSYGTVKHLSTSNSFKRSSVSVIHHQLEEGDTIQGLALKYNIAVQEIQRLNGIWSTDSMFSKSFLKIPMSFQHSNESSRTSTPAESPVHMATGDPQEALTNGRRDICATAGSTNLASLDEEVRSKPRTKRQRAESVTAVCREDGVKNIIDILNCADAQLQASRDFAEKLAQRSGDLKVPADAYHRTHQDITKSSSPTSSLPVPAKTRDGSREASPKASKKRLHLKRVDLTPEKMQESRDKLEENLFEL